MMQINQMILVGFFTPFLWIQSAWSCDDPPDHYEDTCKAVFLKNSAYYAVGVALGYFNESGLKIEVSTASTKDVRSRIGKAAIVQTTGAIAVTEFVKRKDFRIIYTPIANISAGMWAKAGTSVKNVGDLKGLKIGVFTNPARTSALLKSVYASAALPPGFIKTQSFGSTNNTLIAMKKGAVSASMLPRHSDTQAKKSGMINLGFYKVPYTRYAFVVPTKMLASKRDREFYAKFLKSVQKSIKFIKTNRAGTISILQKYLKVKADKGREIYETYRTSGLEFKIGMDAVQTVIGHVGPGIPGQSSKAQKFDAKSLVDFSIFKLMSK
jgi:ABC-type nitrate/sulfonate/bicarbonate transport system substrate-binding protein